METVVTQDQLAEIHAKLDYLVEQVEEQKRRQRAVDELKDDLIPVANHIVKLSIDELAEIGTEFQLEDLAFLLKRLLRNTRSLVRLMDMLEAGMGLSDEMQLIGQGVFADIVETLDRLEREGYFGFMREGWRIVERVVSEFSEEDVRALADNVVTILTTVRNMTQPEILALANNAIGAIHEEPLVTENVSTLRLIRELGDPRVRRGMARMLNIVKALADQPGPPKAE